jgi:hypothetical protein
VALIQQTDCVHISAQIVSLYCQVFDSFGRKPRIRSSRRTDQDNPKCLGFAWLIIEASIIGNLYVCRTVPDVNAGPILRAILFSDVATTIGDYVTADRGSYDVMSYAYATGSMTANCIVLNGERATAQLHSTCFNAASVENRVAGNEGVGVRTKCISYIDLPTANFRIRMIAA